MSLACSVIREFSNATEAIVRPIHVFYKGNIMDMLSLPSNMYDCRGSRPYVVAFGGKY